MSVARLFSIIIDISLHIISKRNFSLYVEKKRTILINHSGVFCLNFCWDVHVSVRNNDVNTYDSIVLTVYTRLIVYFWPWYWFVSVLSIKRNKHIFWEKRKIRKNKNNNVSSIDFCTFLFTLWEYYCRGVFFFNNYVVICKILPAFRARGITIINK